MFRVIVVGGTSLIATTGIIVSCGGSNMPSELPQQTDGFPSELPSQVEASLNDTGVDSATDSPFDARPGDSGKDGFPSELPQPPDL
jgi:hypothetical protein